MAVGRYTISEGLFGAPSTSQLQPLRATSVTEADAGTETGVATAIRNAVAVAMRTLSKLFAFLAVLPFFKAATAEKEVVMDEPMAMESVVVEEEEVVVKPVNVKKIKAAFQAEITAPITATVVAEPEAVAVAEEPVVDAAEPLASVAVEPAVTKTLSKPKTFKIPRSSLRSASPSTIEVRGPRPGKVYQLPRATYRKLGAAAPTVSEATDKFLDGLLKWQDETFGTFSGVDGGAATPEFVRELAPGQRRTWLYFLGRDTVEAPKVEATPMEAASDIVEE